jgi:TPR repeat protein
MKKILLVIFAVLPALLPAWQAAHAQKAADALVSLETASQRHRAGLAMEHRGDDKGAFMAYMEAAERGYPPAQRKLGEIYDSGSDAVERNYPESIRWYQKAREGGEIIPSPPSPMPVMAPRF